MFYIVVIVVVVAVFSYQYHHGLFQEDFNIISTLFNNICRSVFMV